jgi:hypothetical protein
VEPEGLPFEPNLTIEAQGSPLQVSPLTNPQKNFIRVLLGSQGLLLGTCRSSGSLQTPGHPRATWHLGFPLVLTTPLSPLLPPPLGGVGCGAGETRTYRDKEQKSWGKEAKSHLHSGVGPFSFAPLKFQIPVCGQSPNYLTI